MPEDPFFEGYLRSIFANYALSLTDPTDTFLPLIKGLDMKIAITIFTEVGDKARG